MCYIHVNVVLKYACGHIEDKQSEDVNAYYIIYNKQHHLYIMSYAVPQTFKKFVMLNKINCSR